MAAPTLALDPRVFRIFISYASEDKAIATAAASWFRTALPDTFAEVYFDKDFMELGQTFKTQIEAKLQQTNVFIIVYTGVLKHSHGYTGWEAGFFDHIMRTDPDRRKKISLYLFEPPDVTAPDQGVPLGLSSDELKQSYQQYESQLSLLPHEPLCKEIEDWQAKVTKNIQDLGNSDAIAESQGEQNASATAKATGVQTDIRAQDATGKKTEVALAAKESPGKVETNNGPAGAKATQSPTWNR